jgi:hypothetical protein
MTAAPNVRQSVAVADPGNPANVIKPNADGSVNVAGSISASTSAIATAADPSYVEGDAEALSQTLSGHLRTLAAIDQTTPGATNLVAAGQAGSWTVTANLGTLNGAATAAKQPALGTAGTPSADVISVQGIGGGTAIPVSGTVAISGTVAATQSGTWNVGTVTAVTGITNALPAGSNIIGNFRIDQTTPGTTNGVVATGNVASGASDSGNPVKVGGVGSSAPPTAVTAGQRTNVWTNLNGAPVIAASAPMPSKNLSTAPITFSSSGDNTIVAAVGGQTTRVHRMYIVVGGTTSITIKNGAASSLTGAMPLGQNGTLVFDFSSEPWWITSANTAFIINSSAAVQVSGAVEYITSA